MARLTAEHELALEWFARHAGIELPWSAFRLPGGQHLATAAKGIYKPAASKYALSISQRIGSKYADDLLELGQGNERRSRYHQEGPATRDGLYRRYPNEALVQCMDDQVPVGVLVQVSKAPSLYTVVGLAAVVGWEEGSFLLEFVSRRAGGRKALPPWRPEVVWNPPREDTREKLRALVNQRRGQPAFRRTLLEAYKGRCALTSTDVPAALEAAHIQPYLGVASNHVQNGLLLRSDLHDLFDLGLIAIDSKSMRCVLDPALNQTSYKEFSSKKLRLPSRREDWPSPVALDAHRDWAGI